MRFPGFALGLAPASRRPAPWTTEGRAVRAFVFLVGLCALIPAAAIAAPQGDLRTLEQAWHRCIRDAYAHQPAGQSRAGNERNALDECKPHEDAYVAALMTARPDADLPLGGWARTWAAYVSFVVDPIKAWLSTSGR